MKDNEKINYGIFINQVGVIQADLQDLTDLTDWALLEYIRKWEEGGKAETWTDPDTGKVYVWINYTYLKERMPLLKIKMKRNLSYRFKELERLGLIEKIIPKVKGY